MEIFIYFITYTITLLLGFALGYFKFHEEHGTLNVNKVKQFFKKTAIGAVKRPTAETIKKRGTIQEETEKVMEETFDQLLKQ